MTLAIVDGQEVELHNQPGITAIVAQGDMVVEVPGHYLIGPEQTVETSMKLSQTEWEELKAEPNFLKIWNALWDVPPPVLLHKSALASRHVVGMIMMLFMARCNGLKVHLHLPESYLHPVQCQRLLTMVNMLVGKPLK